MLLPNSFNFGLRGRSWLVRGVSCAITILGVLAATATNARAQTSTTATLRGHVEDVSGAVLPGVTITLTNQGTKATQEAVTDSRGQYLFASLFSGTYDLKAELTGFKTYEQKGLTLSPNDTRGLDVRLDVGQRSETVTVTASSIEVIQTETGAREGILTAKQIDNLSVIGRSSLELLRILPGVVAPNQSDLEFVSFGGGANNTQGYTVNGIRSSSNQVQLDGSSLIDIGSNSGVIVTLNNDMVQEVKVEASNFAAEYGTGGMNVSAVTKGGTSRFSGTLYDYNRNYKFAANDRSNSITGTPKPKSKFNYPGGNIGGPILIPGIDWNHGRDKAFFFAGLEIQRQNVDPGSYLSTTLTDKMRRGDLSELLPGSGCLGQNLNMTCGQFNIPAGFPGAGSAAANNNFGPFTHPLGRILASLYPAPNLSTPNNRYNYVFNTLQPTNREDFKFRVDYNITKATRAYVRAAFEHENAENARGIWWSSSDLALPTPTYGNNRGRSVSGNVVSVLSPSMTNEVLVSWSRLTLDNFWRDPSKVRIDGYPELKGYTQGFFPNQSPYLPLNIITSWQGGPGNLWAPAMDVYAHNDALQFSEKLTKIAGAHGLKFGFSAERGRKQQNFQNDEMGQLQFDPWANGGSGSAIADLLTGRISNYQQGTRIPEGHWQYWNYDGFAQDSWKLRSNFTLEFGVRAGFWTNNEELQKFGGYFDPSLYNASKGTFLDPGTYKQLNGWRYTANGQAPLGGVPNRSPFAVPRLNAAWDVTGNGNNVLRGGFGMFYNRNMGNLEYDYLRIPPTSYVVSTNSSAGSTLGNGAGLTYDTLRLLDWTTRVSSLPLSTLNAGSNKWPRTYSFSSSFARRIFFNQVVEAAYVGTRGRDLVSKRHLNIVPVGALLKGTVNGIDLSVPVNRVALDSSIVNQFRPFQNYPAVDDWSFEGVSNYNSLQVTLSRQTGRRLQYFAAYTFGRSKGTTTGNGEYGFIDTFDPKRTYGVLPEDRTHIFNLSWNAFLPDAAKGALNNPIGRGALNGWQLSGISTLASGVPIYLGFSGQAGSNGITQAIFGTPDIIGNPGPGGGGRGGLAPIYTCDPRTGNTAVGEKILNIDCIKIPAFGENGNLIPGFNLRMPTRINHDLTIFKNFDVRNQQKFQFRVGFFDLFNQAWATTNSAADVDLSLDTTCNVIANGLPNGVGGTANNVCDPTGGFRFTDNAKANFGKINLKRGHRVIEFALKYYF